MAETLASIKNHVTTPLRVVEWKEPPPIVGNVGQKYGVYNKYNPLIESLKERPGQWAYCGVGDNRIGYSIAKRFPGVEATGRKRSDKQFDIYLRWADEQ